MEAFFNQEEVDRPRFARLFTNLGEVFPIEEMIDQGRLTHIGTTDEGNFLQVLSRRVFQVQNALDEARISKRSHRGI